MFTTLEYQKIDKHYLHPFTDYKALNGQSTIIEKGQGVYIWDTQGNKILDGMAGLWCVNVGYGVDELAEAAYTQMKQLPYYNSFFKTASPSNILLTKKILEIAPKDFTHVFYTTSGSEAIDTIIKMVWYYWKLEKQPHKQIIIARHNGYHGSNIGGSNLGGMSAMKNQMENLFPQFHHIEQPWWYGEGKNLSIEEYGKKAALALEEKILELGEERVAAFIAEPIQGAGGVIIPPDNYWKYIENICRKYDILLVSDEVICGFGRLGEWFGCQFYNYQPDIISFAKGVTSGYLPLGGVILNSRVAKTIVEKGEEFFHGYTYSGHPSCCAVALKNIELLENGIISNAKNNTMPYFQKRWNELIEHPLVGQVETKGLLGALQLMQDKENKTFFPSKLGVGTIYRDNSIKQGLIMRAVGDRLVISPPLVICHEEIDEIINKVKKTLDITKKIIEEFN